MRKYLPILVLGLVRRFRWFRKTGWRWFYEVFATFDPDGFSFMNYGYAGDEPVVLDAAEEPERYGFQLYNHVIGAVDLTGQTVLEVGCGRGGGTVFVRKYRGARNVVGLDLSQKAIALCARRRQLPGLAFVPGDAERLPFRTGQFDAVVNVESAFCYPSRPAFYREVRRVLKAGGHFLYADIEKSERVPLLDAALKEAGLSVVRREVINERVLKACDLDSERRIRFVNSLYRSRFLRQAFYGFSAVPGALVYEMLKRGELTYLAFVLRPDASAAG